MRYYTGIGSRETPPYILEKMKWIAKELYDQGYVLRSGGARGADQAFEHGLADLAFASDAPRSKEDIQDHAEIYLPWKSFEAETRSWIKAIRDKPQQEAYAIAAKYHPRWKFLTPGAMTFHARNMHQVLGFDVTKPEPSDFIICWTKMARKGGGTGQALRLAEDINIAIYDLANEDDFELITDILLEMHIHGQ